MEDTSKHTGGVAAVKKEETKVAYIPGKVPPEPTPDDKPEPKSPHDPAQVMDKKLKGEFVATHTKIVVCVNELTTLQCTYNAPRIAKAVEALEQARASLEAEMVAWPEAN